MEKPEQHSPFEPDPQTTFDLTNEAYEAVRRFRDELQGPPNPESGIFESGMGLRIQVEGFSQEVMLRIHGESVIGRSDPLEAYVPEVDLSPFAAYRLGVSRRHAILTPHQRQIFVSDLGGRNGTFLNGRRLAVNTPVRLYDGDELQLGKIALKLTFIR